ASWPCDCLDLAPRSIPKLRSRPYRQLSSSYARRRCPGRRVLYEPRLDGKRDAHPAEPGLDPLGAATCRARLDVGADRLRRGVGGRPRRPLRLSHLSHLRLLLCAPVGARPAAPAPPRLPRLPWPDRASPRDRLRDALLDLRPGRRAADGARLDRLLRGGGCGHVPPRPAVLRPGRGPDRSAALAEPLLRGERRRPGLPRHLLSGPDRVVDRARGRKAPPRHRG